jgi:hypothetical protein
MVSEEKILDFVAMRANQTSNDTESGLKLFLPIYSAILGGSIWLTAGQSGSIPGSYQFISDMLVLLVTVVCVYIEIDNLQAWQSYREQLSLMTKQTKHPIPMPGRTAGVIDYVLCVGMGAACLIFMIFNPFKFPLHQAVGGAILGGPG